MQWEDHTHPIPERQLIHIAVTCISVLNERKTMQSFLISMKASTCRGHSFYVFNNDLKAVAGSWKDNEGQYDEKSVCMNR